MENQQANLQMMILLQEWDPLGYGIGSYETEAVDVLQVAYQFDDPGKLARKIQSIFEFSFEEIIALKECENMALQLLTIKNNAACEL
ncbi:DUF1871 family protein [Fredinandcohnia sp. QZ13]|uniref:DUF1871 family protein n=1 Tax=Fredinandcohnia sp. QZ13 TaxID=3073144 RepID=UPI0028537112|nr:DUF1871 family protein [Fredinandcohnia sp. QZ13]MDR4889380.1 DUF1871 family protein [Fredinandcohnia sp. QZ13]